ncbi:MAG: hypothetical protein HY319_13870 [Armatimonadetes bacterium]|nr:hypothetical protein [Armatimonadota bacterium]
MAQGDEVLAAGAAGAVQGPDGAPGAGLEPAGLQELPAGVGGPAEAAGAGCAGAAQGDTEGAGEDSPAAGRYPPGDTGAAWEVQGEGAWV